jgi:Anti-sigma factor NepR
MSTTAVGSAAANPVQQAQGQAVRIMPEEGQGAFDRPVTGLGPEVLAHIGEQLRAAHRQILDEPIPDRFVVLIEALAKKDKG